MSDLIGVNLYSSGSSYLFLREQDGEQRQYFQNQLSIMLEIRNIAVQNEREFFFVVIPNRIQVENYESLTTSFFKADKPNELIQQFCDQHQLRCLDLLPTLRTVYSNDRQSLYFPLDRHFNARGTYLSAVTIFDFLRQYAEQ